MSRKVVIAAIAAAALILGAAVARIGVNLQYGNAAATLPGISGHFALATSAGRAVTDRSFPGKGSSSISATLSVPTPARRH